VSGSSRGAPSAARARVLAALPTGDLALALGVLALVLVLVVPLPTWVIDLGLAASFSSSLLVLMVALFLTRPLEFSSFPTILLLSTLLRLALNVATTRVILTNGHEGPTAAGHVVHALGGYLMGGDVVVGIIVFAILMVVNFMVITKGAGRISEVAARFSLDAMPGKQMAIDTELSTGTIDEAEGRRRRRELEQESAFFGSMDGAAKFVRGDAIAGIIITLVNLLGGFLIGVFRRGLSAGEAALTFSLLTVGDGLVTQIPALLVSIAAGIVVTRSGAEARADQLLSREFGAGPKPLALVAGAVGLMGLMPGMPTLPFLALAGLAAGTAWSLRDVKLSSSGPSAAGAAQAAPGSAAAGEPEDALHIDALRLELGYGLLSLAAGETSRLTEQIRAMRRTIAADLGVVVPSVRVRDNVQLPPDTYTIRLKEIEVARGQLKPPRLLALTPSDGAGGMRGETTAEPVFGLPALWVEETQKEEALARGFTVVDCTDIVVTHLTELLRANAADLLSYAETRRMLDVLPDEQRRLVADLVPAQTSFGTIQRVLQALLQERVSIRDLPTILEGIQDGTSAGLRSVQQLLGTVRLRLARQLSDSVRAPEGHLPIISLGGAWEQAFAEALIGSAEERQLAMPPSRLQEFVGRMAEIVDGVSASGEMPVIVCSGPVRPHLRDILARTRPAVPVLAQGEVHISARIRMRGTI
jgi:flagellar biosynthesis protein FlhA